MATLLEQRIQNRYYEILSKRVGNRVKVSEDDEAWALRELLELAIRNYQQVKKDLDEFGLGIGP